MKKSIAITLSALLAMTISTPVLAVTTDLTDAYSKEIDIIATTSGDNKYSVDVEWGDMTFTYNVGGWDTTEHKYTTNETPTWTSKTTGMTEEEIDDAIQAGEEYTLSSGQVLVRNHSNQPVTTEYKVESANTKGFENVVPDVTAGGEIEACPVLATAGNAGVPYQTATVTLSGEPTDKQENVKVGTLTINITQ